MAMSAARAILTNSVWDLLGLFAIPLLLLPAFG